MKQYFAYVRVSTTRQGEKGSSLQEQKCAIERYAEKHRLHIAAWYQEMETAAKQGRREFTSLIKQLTLGKADGLIVHKIDRSARNLKDWSLLGELIDCGINVHFAHESINLNTRGGRLSADIQAVVAADFIRNLRQEVRKGFYGRLKQGLFPLCAPPGYLNRGSGKVKELDPLVAPLIRQAFELYGTGRYSLASLQAEMARRGLRTSQGKLHCRQNLSLILRNPFYIGLMRIRKTNEVFDGKHEPLISAKLFKRVNDIMDGKSGPKVTKHAFMFKQLVKCVCGRTLTGETTKGFVYYRCHQCAGTCVREESLDQVVRRTLSLLQYDDITKDQIRSLVQEEVARGSRDVDARKKALQLQFVQLTERDARLTDALIDNLIDKDTYNERRAALLKAKRDVIDQQAALTKNIHPLLEGLEKFELGTMALQQYESANAHEKCEIIESVSSNFFISRKSPTIELRNPFSRLQKLPSVAQSGPHRTDVRTGDGSCQGGTCECIQQISDEQAQKVLSILKEYAASAEMLDGHQNLYGQRSDSRPHSNDSARRAAV